MDNEYFAKKGIKPNVARMGSVVQDEEFQENMTKVGNALKQRGYARKLKSARV